MPTKVDHTVRCSDVALITVCLDFVLMSLPSRQFEMTDMFARITCLYVSINCLNRLRGPTVENQLICCTSNTAAEMYPPYRTQLFAVKF